MFRPELRRVALRLSVLGVLLSCLLTAGANFGAKASPATGGRTLLICCSACDVENPPLACRHGCSPSCAK
jgi:hypothetical protein